MRNRVSRAALAVAGSLAFAAAISSAASATDFSINTSVPGGSAWIDGTFGSINGQIHFAGGPAGGEGASVGRIRLTGLDQNNVWTSIPVYCIDVSDWLGPGTFTQTTLDSLTTTQISNVTKFLTYVDSGPTPLVNDTVTSAAAQLGVWEILNESDANSWGLTSGTFYVTQYDSAAIFTAAAQADTWLATLAGGSLSSHGQVLNVLDPGHGNQTQAFISAAADHITVGVPEPTTWAMIVMGFGALGAALRRRKQEDSLFA